MDNKFFQMMVDEIMTIQTEDIRNFALSLIKGVPDYFFSVPASSSGKYHPKNDLGEGGLVRHSISVKRILEHLITPEGYYDFTEREQDLLKLAALFHDSYKSGSQEDYNKNCHTKFNHHILASAFILVEAVSNSFPYEDTKFILDAIASHMGQWNTSTRDTGILPTPKTPAQKVLHMADYLASRKNINLDFDDAEDGTETEIKETSA